MTEPIILWVVQSINLDDYEVEEAFHTEAAARADYNQRVSEGEKTSLVTMRFDRTDKAGRTRTDHTIQCHIFNRRYDGWERHAFNEGGETHD